MYLADYHTHTRFSPDAVRSMTEMAEAAIAAGMDELCFTDHVEPMVWGTTQPRPPYDWTALTADFAEAQAAVGDRIRLRLGLELGDAPWSFSHMEELLADVPPLDFLIGSVHVLSSDMNEQDLCFFDPADEAAARVGIADYLEEVRQLAAWGRFSVLGHLTLPLRYLNESFGFRMTMDGFETEVEEIFRLLIQNGCGIEVNTNRGNAPLPDAKWLRLYRQLGGEIITLGSDAHRRKHVGCAIRERQELLRECGFKHFCTFTAQQPVWHDLD